MPSTEFLIDFMLAALAGRALDCVGCTSLWLALPASVWASRRLSEFIPTWLALSGAAFLFERIGGEPLIVERLIQHELGQHELGQPEGVSSDELLRTESDYPGHGKPGAD